MVWNITVKHLTLDWFQGFLIVTFVFVNNFFFWQTLNLNRSWSMKVSDKRQNLFFLLRLYNWNVHKLLPWLFHQLFPYKVWLFKVFWFCWWDHGQHYLLLKFPFLILLFKFWQQLTLIKLSSVCFPKTYVFGFDGNTVDQVLICHLSFPLHQIRWTCRNMKRCRISICRNSYRVISAFHFNCWDLNCLTCFLFISSFFYFMFYCRNFYCFINWLISQADPFSWCVKSNLRKCR